MVINVIYATDSNYSKVMGISIVSLLENNKQNHINIFIIDDGISDMDKLAISNFANQYDCSFHFINYSRYKYKLVLNQLHWHISESSYARLLLNSMLPAGIEKIIYLDCDTIIRHDLKDFFEIDMGDYFVGGVIDFASRETKKNVGLSHNDLYINAGVLLINLNRWRNYDIEREFLRYIEQCKGNVWHHDQGVINHVMKNKIKIIDPHYNVMTPNYILKYKDIRDFYKISEPFYEEADLKKAKIDPTIIHFTSFFVKRPWEKKSHHPQKNEYLKYKSVSPWNKEKLIDAKAEPFKSKVIVFLYRRIPYRITKLIMFIYHSLR